MKSFWDERFSKETYIYGETPNEQFKEFLDKLPKGKILLPGEGEGRNAVYAALNGWGVVAYDQSSEGRLKALALAKKNQVDIEYLVGDLVTSGLSKEKFDAVALVFLHLNDEERHVIHQYVQSLLKTGGKLFVVGFSKDQVNYSSGGPKDEDMLFSCEMLNSDFCNLKVEKNIKTVLEINEGTGHKGTGSLIIFEGQKEETL